MTTTFDTKTLTRTVTGPHATQVAEELGFTLVFEDGTWVLRIRHTGFRGTHGRVYPPMEWLENLFWTSDGWFERPIVYDVTPLYMQA